ncbi:4830_t:CDS:1 [Ambispora gerdemannii]|uniref:4830_t:CDS:1 n=1 Tax=Ambispora gerdemannii TaxID=144530 RepID=A0A9N8ZXH9_9GLOM|nr:4830_t:CDS:1 [Ambispora gerdemannii]
MASTATLTATDSRTNKHHSHYYSTTTTTTSTSSSPTQQISKTKIRNPTSSTGGSWNNIPVDLDDPGSYSYHPTAAMVEAAKIDYANRLFKYTFKKLCRTVHNMKNNGNNKTTTITNGTTTRRNAGRESTSIDAAAVSSRAFAETLNSSEN